MTRDRQNQELHNRKPELGVVLITVGVGIGVIAGLALDQLAVGVGIGTALGALAAFVARRIQNRPNAK
jgi:hypothetical protein